MLSKMLVTTLDEEIHELISYYKFLLKLRTQNKNHLEAINVKNPNSIVSKKITKEIKSIIKKDKYLYEAFTNILQFKELEISQQLCQ